MTRVFFGVVSLTAILVSVDTSRGQSPHIAATEPRTPAEQRKTFHLPPGFVIQLVAAEPKVNKPINIAFDAAGRLWVTESVEYPFPAPAGRKAKDRVKILEDFGSDGLARKVTTFADELNIPIGVLPIAHGAIVYSIPNVFRLLDTDGDGRADRRDVLLGTYGFGDTHGMTGEFTRGFDGWVYACHGFANTSKVKASGRDGISMQSGNIYRFKPDGSRVEHFSHGQVNPFGLCFDPLGNLYSCDCHSRPIYQLLRGAYYPSFGRPDDGLGNGPEMMSHDHGSTAIGGIAFYAATQFPKEYRDNIFVGNVVTNRINRDRLEWHGSSPRAIEMPDLVRCDDPWFRPVDIKLGPDGALYVADFYNRIIGHYEVPLNHPGRDRFRGRIWRIVYTGPDGTKPTAASDLTKSTLDGLVKALDDANLTIRMQAAEQLVERGGRSGRESTSRLLKMGSAAQKVQALWISERVGDLDGTALVHAAKDKEPVVRVHAMRVLSEWGNWSEQVRALALAGMDDDNPFVKRAAAQALGVHPDARNAMPLLRLLRSTPGDDTHLRHVARMALRDQLVPAATWTHLSAAALSHEDSNALADVCPGLRSRESAAFLLDHLRRRHEDRGHLIRCVHHIARYGTDDSARDVLAFSRERYKDDLGAQADVFKSALQGLQERGALVGTLERAWLKELVSRLLRAPQEPQVQAGIELAGAFKVGSAAQDLVRLATNRKIAEAPRKSALAALMAIDGLKHIPTVSRLLVDPGEPPALREQAANSLAATNQPAAQAELVKALESAPASLQKVIALALAGSAQGADKLLDAVAAGKASARLLQDRPVELRLEQARPANLRARLAKLTRGLPPADIRLQQLLAKRQRGFALAKADPAIGLKVFEKNCAACHQIKNQGAKIGPQLDGIGIRGLDRLLEDILDPNRNVDQAFRATTLTLKNGQIVTGLFLRQDGAVLVLADAQGKELRTPAENIDERAVSQLSPMPATFAEQIAQPDFYHLLAFLLRQRAK